MPPKSPTRNKVNYASQFLYSCFDAVGNHFANHNSDDKNVHRNKYWNEIDGGNQVRQLHRIQGINHSFQTNFIDINEYGRLARIEKTFLETPNVTLDFEYYLADGYNEQVVGFIIDGKHQALRKHIMPQDRLFGQNFFIVQVPDGHDVIHANLDDFNEEDVGVIGIGNAFLSQYALTAEVGSAPKARLSYEAANIRSYKGFKNLPIPAYDFSNQDDCFSSNKKFSIPNTYESFLYETLPDQVEDIHFEQGSVGVGPGDLRISLDNAGYISQNLKEINDYSDGAAHIQGFTINVPMGSTKLSRIGTSLEYHRSYNFPAKIDIQVRALMGDIRESKGLCELGTTQKHNLVLIMQDPRSLCNCNGILQQEYMKMAFYIKGAVLDAEGFSSSIGDNKVVDLNFSAQIGGPEDSDSGLFIYGSSFFPDRPRIVSWGQPLFKIY
tara:strand:+ start:320 stop:1633 length:1314 start_codon:yes stop_codon:yes gene_type:complete